MECSHMELEYDVSGCGLSVGMSWLWAWLVLLKYSCDLIVGGVLQVKYVCVCVCVCVQNLANLEDIDKSQYHPAQLSVNLSKNRSPEILPCKCN